VNYGRYEIVREVGRGSMGVVYQARDPRIDRLVAVKVLRQDRITSDTLVRRFLKEAKAIGRLNHPHIVTVYDVGEEKGTVYIAMEFLEGVSLAEFTPGKQLNVKEIATIGIQLAETLDFAHLRGVIHRDIKPSNIIMQNDGNIKITDFGIAHVEDPSDTMQTQVGEIMGTPAYMSPEQVLGQTIDGRSDIFSLGIILYELSTGRRPFGGENKSLLAVFDEIAKITPQEPFVSTPHISRELSYVIMKALEKEREKRFQTGRDFAEALRGCLKEMVKDKAVGPPVRKYKHKLNYALSFGVAIAVAIAIGGGYFFLSQNRENSGIVPALKDSAPSEVKEFAPSLPTESQRTEQEGRDLKGPPGVSDITPSSVTAELQSPQKVESPSSKDQKQKNTSSPTHVTSERTKVTRSDTLNRQAPRDKRDTPTSSASGAAPGSNEQSLPNVALKPVQKFAFLKVGTTPSGAQVYINGVLKGTTPIILKLDLGQYFVRLSFSGYQGVERQIKLDKMMEYPLMEHLKPLE